MTEIQKVEIDIDSPSDMERIESYLRSVYRYLKMLDIEAPDILVNMEKIILFERMKQLNHEEVVMSYLMWPGFYDESVVRDALLDAQIDQDMKNSQPS